MIRRLHVLTWAAVVCLVFSVVGRVSGAQDVYPEGLSSSSNPLEIARAVARSGDGLVIAALGGVAPERSLLAIHCAPQLAEPEAALPVLAALALGHDPDLAPAAALAAYEIAQELTASALAAREVSGEDLAAAAQLFGAVAHDESARPDIRQAARLIVARLEYLSGS